MSKVCSERLHVRNELLGLEVNQSPKSVCQVKHSRLFFLPEVKTVAQFNNYISSQLTGDGGEATCSTLQENCLILSYHFSYCVFSSFLVSLLLLPYCLFPPAPSFLGTIMFPGGFNQWVTRTLFLPGSSDKYTCSLHKPGPHKAIKSPGSLEYLETSQTNWFFFSPLSQKPVWLKQSNLWWLKLML